MPHSVPLHSDALKAITDQLAVLLPDLFPKSQRHRFTLHETFPIWLLEPDFIHSPPEPLHALGWATGRWHHQIWAGNRPVACAESMPLGPGGYWSVREVYDGTFAEQVDRAISRADQEVDDSYTTHLLDVPAFQVDAFWFSDAESCAHRVLVIQAPEQLKLDTSTVLTARQFLDALIQARPVVGIRS